MVDEGSMFENAYIHVPICNPSRSTTLTGRYFHNIKTTNTSWASMHCDMNRVHNSSFAKRLKGYGYTVGLFGKYLNAIPGANITRPGAYVPEGFDAWFANGGGNYISPQFATSGLEEFSSYKDGAVQFNTSVYSTSIIGNTSLAWIRHTVKTKPSQPFFAYIAPKAAHEPFNPAPWYVCVCVCFHHTNQDSLTSCENNLTGTPITGILRGQNMNLDLRTVGMLLWRFARITLVW